MKYFITSKSNPVSKSEKPVRPMASRPSDIGKKRSTIKRNQFVLLSAKQIGKAKMIEYATVSSIANRTIWLDGRMQAVLSGFVNYSGKRLEVIQRMNGNWISRDI